MTELPLQGEGLAVERGLPDRVVVGKNGAYWREYPDHYSMCPVSEDNDPVEPVAIYVRVDGLKASVDAVADALNAWDQGEPPRPDTHRDWNRIAAALQGRAFPRDGRASGVRRPRNGRQRLRPDLYRETRSRRPALRV